MLEIRKITVQPSNKGFIHLQILLAAIVLALAVSSVGYAFYKKNEPTEIVKPVTSSRNESQEVLGGSTEPGKETSQQPTKVAEAPEPTQPVEKPLKYGENTQPSQDAGKLNDQPPAPVTEGPETYSIIPLGDISSFPERERALWIEAYNEFLQTPNLQYMNYEQQKEYFLKIADRYYAQYKRELEQGIQQQQELLEELQELNSSAGQTPPQSNPEIEAKLKELSDTLESIQNKPVAMSVIEGKKQRAYQDWVKDNPEVYSEILATSYINDLNAILKAYGLD